MKSATGIDDDCVFVNAAGRVYNSISCIVQGRKCFDLFDCVAWERAGVETQEFTEVPACHTKVFEGTPGNRAMCIML